MSLKRLHPKYENITSKWGNMSLRIEMGKRIDNWLSVFPNDNKGILLKLLSSFYYYDEAHVKGKAKSLYEAFINRFEGDPSEIIYTKIHNDHTAAHSDVFFTQFWMTNEIYNNSVVDIIPLIEEQVPRTLAIVDDFSGSGLSLMSTINRILEANSGAKEIEYCFLVLHITEYAEESIRDYGKAVGIDIKIFPLECSKKAFTKDAEFKGITDKYELFINQILQKNYININEEGTQACTATELEIMLEGYLTKDETAKDFMANRPFIFIIRNEKCPKGHDIIFFTKVCKFDKNIYD